MAETLSLRIYNTLPIFCDFIPTTWIHPESWILQDLWNLPPNFRHRKKMILLLFSYQVGFCYRWLDAHVCLHPVHLEMPSLAVAVTTQMTPLILKRLGDPNKSALVTGILEGRWHQIHNIWAEVTSNIFLYLANKKQFEVYLHPMSPS